MTENIVSILSTLRDVAGVHGSFVIADDGTLVGKDLPSIFDASLFREVGPRIVRLRDTFQSGGDDMETCAMRFSEHQLFVRVMKKGYLCVLSANAVNMPALKMGTQLAQRRVQAELTSANGSVSQAAPASTNRISTYPQPAQPAPAATPAAAPGQRPQMLYRGNVLR